MRSGVDDPVTDAFLEKNRALSADDPALQESINETYCHIAEQSYSIWIADSTFRPAVGTRTREFVAGPAFAGRPVFWSNAYIGP